MKRGQNLWDEIKEQIQRNEAKTKDLNTSSGNKIPEIRKIIGGKTIIRRQAA